MPITLHLLRSFLSRLTTMYLLSFARLTTSSSVIPGVTFVVDQPRSLRYSSSPNNCSSRRTVGRCISSARFGSKRFDERFLRSFPGSMALRKGRDCYFLKYLRHFLHWKRFSEIFLSGTLQNGQVSRVANFSADPANASVLRPGRICPVVIWCLLE